MSTPTRVLEGAHLVTLAALTAVVALDPTARLRSAPDWAGWLAGQQRLDRVMSRIAPPLFLSTAATAAGAALVAVGQHRTELAVTRIASAACVTAAVAVTLVVNEPANERLRTWRPSDVPPDDWREVRARWDRGHRWRRGLVVAAAAAAVWGLLRSSSRRRAWMLVPDVDVPVAAFRSDHEHHDVARSWLQSAAASFEPIGLTERSGRCRAHRDESAGLPRPDGRGPRVADAAHAATVIEAGATWVTSDRDFARFPGLRWRTPREETRG